MVNKKIENHKNLVRQLYTEVHEKNNFDFLDTIFHPEFSLRYDNSTLLNKKFKLEYFRELLTKYYQIFQVYYDIIDLFGEGDKILASVKRKDIDIASKYSEVNIITIFYFENGKIKYFDRMVDNYHLYSARGILEKLVLDKRKQTIYDYLDILKIDELKR